MMQNKVHDHPTAHSAPPTPSIAWLGLDAHAQNCVLAQLDDDGTQRRFWRIPTQGDKLVAQVQAIAASDKRLALEESNLARWLWQLLRPHVAQLVVCDARHNKLISSHPNKKDERDAFTLARLFRLHELKPVWQVPSDARALFKKAISYRAWLQAMKRQSGAVHRFFLWSKQHTGSATHARLNTQRKLLRAWWTLWQEGKEWDEEKFFPTAK